MYSIVYGAVCIILANLLYKPRRMKLKIAKSPVYAVFVGVWLLVFSVLLYMPARALTPIHYSLMPLFVFTTILWFVSPWIVRKLGKKPGITGDIGKNLLMDFRTHIFFTKYFEILAQQTLFIYILFVVLRGSSDVIRMVWFLIFILIIHLANIFFMEKKHALLFTYFSIPMAVGFGYLILHGYIFVTASIHLLFYILYNGRYWFGVQEHGSGPSLQNKYSNRKK